MIRSVLSHPSAYHHLRQIMTLGMPFRAWIPMYGFDRPTARIADIGCGPADVLRFLPRGTGPEFYLGLDMSDAYLAAAKKRADRAGLASEFVNTDLSRIPTDEAVRRQVKDRLAADRIDTALLLGVIHHLDDDSVRRTLDLVYDAGVKTLVTSDVIYLAGHRVNNLFCDYDRGEHVRTEAEYDTLLNSTAWPRFTRQFTHPGLRYIQYVHHTLTRE